MACNPIRRLLLLVASVFLSFSAFAQSAGEVMFVAFDSDNTDYFSFVTLVELPDGTSIHFNDNEWSNTGSSFNDSNEGEMTWLNDTGATIRAGTIVTVSPSTTSATIGSMSGSGIDLAVNNEVLYMFTGSDSQTPTTFLCAIANNGFSAAKGELPSTLSASNSINFNTSLDVMVYNGTVEFTSTVATVTSTIADETNWTGQGGAGDQSTDSTFPDMPGDVPCRFFGSVFPSITYYSVASGAWDDENTWTTSSDGSGGPLITDEWPGRYDHVVIMNGHTVTVDNTGDNTSCGTGVAPDDLGLSNVGTFTGSNSTMFYHDGNLVVNNGGSLTLSVRLMLGGYTRIAGTLTVSNDVVNIGYMEIMSTATTDFDDDFILSGNSVTLINNTTTSTDDLYLDWTDAQLCGDGIMNTGNGSGDPTVNFFNGATGAQICTSFSVTCTANCGGFSNGSPSGTFSFGNTGPGGVGDLVNNIL